MRTWSGGASGRERAYRGWTLLYNSSPPCLSILTIYGLILEHQLWFELLISWNTSRTIWLQKVDFWSIHDTQWKSRILWCKKEWKTVYKLKPYNLQNKMQPIHIFMNSRPIWFLTVMHVFFRVLCKMNDSNYGEMRYIWSIADFCGMVMVWKRDRLIIAVSLTAMMAAMAVWHWWFSLFIGSGVRFALSSGGATLGALGAQHLLQFFLFNFRFFFFNW